MENLVELFVRPKSADGTEICFSEGNQLIQALGRPATKNGHEVVGVYEVIGGIASNEEFENWEFEPGTLVSVWTDSKGRKIATFQAELL
jgi:hypothetical protein